MTNPGDTRVRRKFLLFPVILKEDRRWWSTHEVLQFHDGRGWKNLEWNEKVARVYKEEQFHSFSCTSTGQIHIEYKDQDRYSIAKDKAQA